MGSRFIDRVVIDVEAGHGGDGCVAFRREKYIPRGGPSGGDGGHGGDVVLVADSGMNTLYDFRYRPRLKAGNGRPGMGDNRSGKSGDDWVAKVPPGTTVLSGEALEVVGDLTQPGERLVVARGGRGGKGNQHFATARNRAPRRAEPGKPGEAARLTLELRSIADVGLVGLPNAGKSTLLRAISSATPEVADYPFTTLTPHLGVVSTELERIVVADIPGLVEGASQGRGLGHEFLRHVERTSVLLYVVDASGYEGDPVSDFLMVRREVVAYSEAMKDKVALLALNKVDLVGREQAQIVADSLRAVANMPLHIISAKDGDGVETLIQGLFGAVRAHGDSFLGQKQD